jgi:hypothetical protein
VGEEDQLHFIETIWSTFEEFTKNGSYEESARLPRLTVLHNPYAAHPLHMDVFGGPHDVQWAEYPHGDTVVFTEVAHGTSCFELPDRHHD